MNLAPRSSGNVEWSVHHCFGYSPVFTGSAMRLLMTVVALGTAGCVSQAEIDRRNGQSAVASVAQWQAAGRPPPEVVNRMVAVDRQSSIGTRQEQGLRMMEFGFGMMAGDRPAHPQPSSTRTFNINGRLITCTTSGSSTDCF